MSRRLLFAVLMGLMLLPVTIFSQTLEEARAFIRVRDYESAFSIYATLARSGDTEAMYQFASMYRAGRGIEEDPALAAQWMSKAAHAGHARAQYSMGQLLQGTGVDEDLVLARDWYERAAKQGHSMARNSLTVLNQKNGKSVDGMTATERVNALRQSVRQGNPEKVRTLLDNDSNEILGNSEIKGILIDAIHEGNEEILDILLRIGVDPDGSDDGTLAAGQAIPLHAAVRAENSAAVSLFI